MRAWVGMLGAVVCLGCGVSTAAGDGGGTLPGRCPIPATINAQNFVDALMTADVCGQALCSPIPDGLLDEAKKSPFELLLSEGFTAAIANGTLAVDYARAPVCLEAYSNGCRAYLGKLPPECEGVLIPKQSIGQVCYSPSDCITGICEDEFGGCAGDCVAATDCESPRDCASWSGCSDGACVAPLAAGEDCTSDDACAAGLACVASICAPPGGSGAACTADTQCALGLFCKPSAPSSSDGKCSPTLALGQPCLSDHLSCSFGAYCADTCTAYGALGGACVPTQGDVVMQTCQFGLNCGSNSICALPPASGPCDDETGIPCSLQSYCDDNHTCQALLPNGQQCNRQLLNCVSGNCGVNGLCSAPGTACLPN